MHSLRLLLCGTFLAMSGFSATTRSTASVENNPAVDFSGTVGGSKCWIFMHLQKTGGSTLNGILSECFSPKFAKYGSSQWKQGSRVLESVVQKLVGDHEWNVVSGAYSEALHSFRVVDEQCKFFTVFRHPISRMVSAYYYCKHTAGDPTCASMVVNANDVDMVEFAKHWGNYAMRQFATNLIPVDDVMAYSKTDTARRKLPETVKVASVPGWYWLKMYLDDQAPALDNGKANIPEAALYQLLQPVQDLIRDRYAAVGILEEFNTTLSLFNSALAMPGIDWHEQFNTQGKKVVDIWYKEQETQSLAEAWTDSEIKKYMTLDIVLYEHAVDVFQQQLQAHGVE